MVIGNLTTTASPRRYPRGTDLTVATITPAQNTAAARELVSGFSLEMTGKDVPGLQEAAHSIPQGTKINVTFLGNEDLDMRVTAAKAVKDLGFVPVPHISARRLKSQDQLEEFLGRLQEVGATEHVFAVGGDPTEPEGPYPDSLSVIRTGLLQKYGVREVSIAGYPEGHPDIKNDVLWRHLEDKSASLKEQGLDAVILTQFAFDTDPVLTWIKGVRDRGIDTQIRIGTPGPAGIKRLLGFARRFGIGANAMIVKKYGFSLTNLMGTAGPDKFVTDLSGLLADASAGSATGYGDVKLHFYTFGGLLATSEWVREYLAAQA
jgi:methylenetetrahydrofolate reductase (NADPH)